MTTILTLYIIIQATPQQKADLKTKHQGSSSIRIGSAIAEEQSAKTSEENLIVKDADKKHILMYHPWGTKSHKGHQYALLHGLLDTGHTVTGVFPEASNIVHDGYTEIVVETR